jgi:UDP-2,4-diacetamido-2,4,6-trideoxy-beta-L-altropyranose hydrolase
MIQPCLLRTDADEATGFGHFSRCLSLAQRMGAFDFRPFFVLKHYTDSVILRLDKAGLPYAVIPADTVWVDEANFLRDIAIGRTAALILDICHSYTLRGLEGFGDYVKLLGDAFRVVTLLDGLANDALIKTGIPEVDLVVTPYCGAENLSPKGERGFFHLAGPEFMVFQEEYEKTRQANRPILERGGKILLTFGGSDPKGLTVQALQALSLITDRRLEIHFVIGPAFKDALKSEIREVVKEIKHGVTLVESPPTLAREMMWCDLAISSTGLTKYELALTGTPSVFLSIDEDHHAANRAFSKAQTGVDLGVYTGLTPGDIKGTVLTLLDDATSRHIMSRNGLNVVDLHGAEQILSHIRRLFDE